MDNIDTLNYKHQYRDSGDYLKKPFFSKKEVNKHRGRAVFKSSRNKVKPIAARFDLLIGRGKMAKIQMGKDLHETRANKIQSIPRTLKIIKKGIEDSSYTPQDAQEMLRFDHTKTRENLLKYTDNCKSPYTQSLNTYYSRQATTKLEQSDYYVTLYNAMDNISEGRELQFFNEVLELAIKCKKDKKLTDNKYHRLRYKLDNTAIEYTQQVLEGNKAMEDIQSCEKAVTSLIGVKEYIDSIENNSNASGLFKSFLQRNEHSGIGAELIECINEVLNKAIYFLTQNNTDTDTDNEKLLSDILSSLSFILTVISHSELKLLSEERFKIIYAVLCNQLCEFIKGNQEFFESEENLSKLRGLCNRLDEHYNKNKNYYYKSGDCIKNIKDALNEIIKDEECTPTLRTNPSNSSFKPRSISSNSIDSSHSFHFHHDIDTRTNKTPSINPTPFIQTSTRRDIGLEGLLPYGQNYNTTADMHCDCHKMQVSLPQPQPKSPANLMDFDDNHSNYSNTFNEMPTPKVDHHSQTPPYCVGSPYNKQTLHPPYPKSSEQRMPILKYDRLYSSEQRIPARLYAEAYSTDQRIPTSQHEHPYSTDQRIPTSQHEHPYSTYQRIPTSQHEHPYSSHPRNKGSSLHAKTTSSSHKKHPQQDGKGKAE